MIFVKAYGGALIVFLVLDAIWLGLVAKSYYANQLGALMRESPNLLVAGIFYIGYVAGLIFLVVTPALNNTQSLQEVLVGGAVLGFIAYGTYDFTNLATLKDWPIGLVFVDLIWGTFLTAAAAGAGFLLAVYW